MGQLQQHTFSTNFQSSTFFIVHSFLVFISQHSLTSHSRHACRFLRMFTHTAQGFAHCTQGQFQSTSFHHVKPIKPSSFFQHQAFWVPTAKASFHHFRANFFHFPPKKGKHNRVSQQGVFPHPFFWGGWGVPHTTPGHFLGGFILAHPQGNLGGPFQGFLGHFIFTGGLHLFYFYHFFGI